MTLYELNWLVRRTIETTMDRDYWVEAELSEARTSRGHCYMELVQKDDRSNTPIARASAKCWASQWSIIEPHFVRTTGQQLHAGMKVLLKVYPQFHEAYGFSWIVTDIDPTFTLGDLARRRQEIIRQLKEEGIFDLQKTLRLPLFCQRIAVISSATAAGYGDFVAQLNNNEYGFKFHTQLFPAIMQGEQVEASIIAALDKIYKSLECRDESVEFATAHDNSQDGNSSAVANSTLYTLNSTRAVANSTLDTLNSKLATFDCVVIIRGGGATADMSGFDTLELAENVANFPLPVITGIGHDRDECVLDMISYMRVKTPTAAADLLINNLKAVLDMLNDSQERIVRHAQYQLSALKTQIASLQEVIPRLFGTVKMRQEARLEAFLNRLSRQAQTQLSAADKRLATLLLRLPAQTGHRLLTEKHRLQLLEEKARSLDPALLLKRGYSMTLVNGRLLRDAAQVKPGDEIETRLEKGTVKSIVE